MEGYVAKTYGERIAAIYDQRYPSAVPGQVDLLAELAGTGPVLELGIGTGRLALRLAARGVEVHGIDASPAMVERLRAKPGGDEVTVAIGDFGRWLATGSDDRTARIWDAGSGSELAALRGHDSWIRAVAWSPDGQRITSASNDRTVRIWDAGSGTGVIIVGVHAKGVDSVSWSPDGRRIASASRDGTCRIWDATISIEDLVINGHRRVSR